MTSTPATTSVPDDLPEILTTDIYPTPTGERTIIVLAGYTVEITSSFGPSPFDTLDARYFWEVTGPYLYADRPYLGRRCSYGKAATYSNARALAETWILRTMGAQ